LFICILCGGNVFTEPLPNNDRGRVHIKILSWEGFMKYAVEMGSGAIIYIYIYIYTPSFIKIGSGIQKLTERIHRYTDSMVIA
jgi:hypothetical protein